MEKLSSKLLIRLAALFLTPIAAYLWVIESEVSKKEIVIISAVEKPIKIQPRNTSCMPLIKKSSVHSLEVAIPYEIQSNEWLRPKDTLNYRHLEDKTGDETVLINVSEHPEKTTIDPRHSVKDKKVLKRASSLNILLSCNNDI